MDRMLTHLTHLVDDLLDVSRVSQGKISLKKARIALSEVLQSAIEASQHNLDAESHRFIIDIPERSDLARSRSHAAGSGRIQPAQQRRQIYALGRNGFPLRQGPRRHGRDQGHGYGGGHPVEMQPRIFEIFAQVEDHLAKAQGGLGIGLALVKQLVALHGGTIDVESAGQNMGSAFSVRIPIAAEPLAPDA
jgi:signal transduction histidine kinase